MWVLMKLLKIHCRVGWRKNKEVGEGGGKSMCEEKDKERKTKEREQKPNTCKPPPTFALASAICILATNGSSVQSLGTLLSGRGDTRVEAFSSVHNLGA